MNSSLISCRNPADLVKHCPDDLAFPGSIPLEVEIFTTDNGFHCTSLPLPPTHSPDTTKINVEKDEKSHVIHPAIVCKGTTIIQ